MNGESVLKSHKLNISKKHKLAFSSTLAFSSPDTCISVKIIISDFQNTGLAKNTQ